MAHGWLNDAMFDQLTHMEKANNKYVTDPDDAQYLSTTV